MVTYLLECLVIHETGRVFWNFQLALLNLLTELPKAVSVTHVHRGKPVATKEMSETQPGRRGQLMVSLT